MRIGFIEVSVVERQPSKAWRYCKLVTACVRLWLFNFAIAIDQLGNALIGGDPQETISSRAGKLVDRDVKWACVLCKFLDAVDARHCATSRNVNQGRDSVPTLWRKVKTSWP